MINYLAIKTHYDHRPSLPRHLKYSRYPNQKEYDEYLSLFYEEGVGGEGFHECLNFNTGINDRTPIYLPPGYVPAKEKCSEDFIIFTFSYKTDQELPSHILGVHAGVRIKHRDGIPRDGTTKIKGIKEEFIYHAESPSNLTTLFSEPIPYDYTEGRYTPQYKFWGNGLRYIEKGHAKRIIEDALYRTKQKFLNQKDGSKKLILEREIEVLNSIGSLYLDIQNDEPVVSIPFSLPDKELGYLGEQYVYGMEQAKLISKGEDPALVEWVSQVFPFSVFDIKTIRKSDHGYVPYYLEVKSTTVLDYSNIHISSNQIEYFKNNPETSIFVFVKFDKQKKVLGYEEYTIKDLERKFSLKPTQFKLLEK
jgi:hypothetical protein